MAKQTKAKLDKKGLSGLGLEKLVDILLEESAANKALKARLQTALAGETGPDEMARLIDKRLDAIDQATTRINRARAKDLSVEFAALARNILSELGEMCDSLLFINNGRIVHHGDAETLKRGSDSVGGVLYDVQIDGDPQAVSDWCVLRTRPRCWCCASRGRRPRRCTGSRR